MRTFAITMLAAMSMAATAQQLGVEFDGDVYNMESGAFIGNSGFARTNGASFRNGVTYAVADNQLYTVNKTTGAGTLVGLLNLGGATDTRALAFDMNGDIYVVVNASPSDELWRVNPTTLVGTLVGAIGDSGIQGLEFDHFGNLYAWTVRTTGDGGLWRIDPNTGAGTDVNPALGQVDGIQCLYVFGTALRGAHDLLSSVNKTSGSTSVIGNPPATEIRGVGSNQEFVAAKSFVIRLGRQNAGNLEATFRTDGNALQVCKFIVPNQQVAPVTVEFSSVLGGTRGGTLLEFFTVSRMAHAGSFSITHEMFNFRTNTWDLPQTQSIGTILTLLGTSKIGNLLEFIDPDDNECRGRVQIRQTGPSAVVNWCWNAEQVTWNWIQ